MHRPIAVTMPVAVLALLAASAHGQPPGDPLPSGAVARLGTDRFFHPGNGVYQLIVSPDGKHVISHAGTLKLWETATGRELPLAGGKKPVLDRKPRIEFQVAGKSIWMIVVPETEPPTYSDAVTGEALVRERNLLFGRVAVRPDGRAIAYTHDPDPAKAGLPVRLRDLKTDKTSVLCSYPPEEDLNSLMFSADGRRLAVARGAYRGTDVWDVVGQKVLFNVPNTGGTWAEAAWFTADGKRYLAESRKTGAIRQWDVATGRPLPDLPGKSDDWGRPADLHPDGRHLVYVRGGAHFVVADPAAGKAIFEIPMTSDRRDVPCTAVFTPDGKRLITADGADISVWDAVTGRRLIDRFHSGNLTGLAWSPDGRRIATAADGDAVARVWDAASGKLLATPTGHAGGLDAVAWSPDGTRLATWGKDQTLRLWMANGREVARTTVEVKYPSGLTFTPAGHLLAVASGGAVVWDPATTTPRPLADPPADIFTSALVADGTALVIWHHGPAGVNNVTVRDAATGRVRVRHPLTCEYLLAVSPDARAALTRQANGDLELVSLVDGRRRWVHPPAKEDKDHPAHPGAFAPDGRTVAVSRWDRGLRILEVATGAERLVIRHPTDRVYALAFSPDGTRLAAAGGRSVLVWDVTRPTAAVPKSAEAGWTDLASPDAAAGFAAVRAWVAHPAEAVRLARERVQPIAAPDAKQVAKWIEQLDAPRFAAREAASRGLTGLGESVQLAVRDALKGSPSAEARQRLEAVLSAATDEGPLSSERLRSARAVEALERIGTADAKKELERLAAGAAGAGLTRDAAASLGRLMGR